MNSIILHSILALLSALGSIATYLHWRKTGFQKEAVKRFSWLFFFLFWYYFSYIFSFFFFRGNLSALAWGIIVSVAFLFIGITFMWKVILGLLNISLKKINFIARGFLLMGLITILFLIIDFRLPIIHESGFIILNINFVSALLIILGQNALPAIWLFIILKNWPRNLGLVEKLKAASISFACLLIIFSGVYFLTRDYRLVIAGYSLVIAGITFLTATFLFSSKKTSKISQTRDINQLQ